MRRGSVLAVVVVVLAGAGCGGAERSTIVLDEVRVSGQTVVFRDRRGSASPLDGKALRASVVGALERSRNLVVEPGAEPPSARLRVEAMVEIDTDAREGRVVVALRTERERTAADARARAAVPLRVTVVRQGAVHGQDARSLLEGAATAAVRGLDAQARLVLAGDKQVLEGLESTEDDVRILAARLAAVRRIRGAAARVARLLSSPRQEVRDAAMGALIELKDPSAVRPLIDSARSDDPESQLRIVEALAAIGGDEAAQYLELLASGSEEPDIREAASRARARLAGR